MSRNGRLMIAALIAVTSLTAVRLAFWQLDRHNRRREANTLQLGSRNLPPLDLNTPGAADSSMAGRRITVSGRWDTVGQMVLRNRAHREAPGLHVMTRFRISGSQATLWVLRGFLHSADGVSIATVPAPPGGEVSITGIALALPETDHAGQMLVVGSDTTWNRIDRQVALARDSAALDGMLYLEGDGAGGLPVVVPPPLDGGPHFNYTLQWFGIAIAIAAFGFIALRPRPSGPGQSRHPAVP